MTTPFNCLIMGAAGRDFHDFQVFFAKQPQFRVRAFTAAQIPFIEQRSFPKSLAGPQYDEDIPIFSESRLSELIRDLEIDFVFLAYSDLAHVEVMHRASLVQACGAGFAMLGPRHTQLRADRPVIAVTASRTGAGKSPLSQFLAQHLTRLGVRVGVMRHPMPYGDLQQQAFQRFETPQDLDRFECTVEEREEYEPYVELGVVIHAGVDYARVLAEAQRDSDVLLWDGGNNDYSFVRPDLSIVVVDALRPGHEMQYYPGETNFRAADVIVINKVENANPRDVELIRESAAAVNPEAEIIEADLEIQVDQPERITGRRVLVVEDGPTLTHGGTTQGAGTLAAKRYFAAERLEPRSAAKGSIAEALQRYPRLKKVLPALGYSPEQVRELRDTILASGAELLIDA
ncbi:MAG: tetraacyldisaccharide 4'-kinase, partial [Planctomycetales bacterium]